jgi:hypothetical protein
VESDQFADANVQPNDLGLPFYGQKGSTKEG